MRQEVNARRRLNRRRRRRRRLIRRCVFAAIIFGIVTIIIALVWKIFSADLKDADSGKSNSSKVNSDTEDKKESADDLVEASSGVITLQDSGSLQIKLGEPFNEPGYSAKDKDGTDLTDQVKVDTSALNRAGDRKVVYTVMGNNGVEAEAVREIEILPNTEYSPPGLPICMYHYVYDSASPPDNLDSNYISTEALAEEMNYLHENGYYFPTWQEVRDYVDGKLLLPEKSIVLTFDDGPNYMYLGTPVLEKYQTPATSFVIASYWDSREMLYGYASDYLRFESHSYQMHQGGGNIGHGGIYTALSKEEVLADLQKSFEICGNHEAFAYPFGDYTQEGCATLEEAGLLCAVTTENAKCYPGDNPYLLPRIRMLGTQTLEEFAAAIN